MLTGIWRGRMQAGKEEEAIEVLRNMVEAVQANEPGALAYICHRSQDDPSEIVLFEIYADDAAVQAHGQTPHWGEFLAIFADLFDASTAKIERLDRLGGFVRPELS